MNRRVRFYVFAAALTSVGLLVAAALLYPPSFSVQYQLALLILVGLTLLSNALGVTVDEQGTRTSYDFIVHLTAVQLLGPFGAGIVGGLPVLLFEATATDKPPVKYLFNTFQFAISATAAGLIFVALGGTPNLNSLGYPETIFPFVGAAIADTVVNTGLVTGIIAAERQASITAVWRELKGTLVFFDIVFSLIGYGIAALYIEWGPLALVLTVVPLLGLRYFYGVNVKLKNLSKDLTRVLVRTIEAQDAYTSGHSLRVSEYARRIAQEMDLGYGRTYQIETAALLHDIGKIDRAYRTILTQEGPLTDQQRELIEAHPDRGADLLESVRALDDEVLAAVRYHHERYDGDGYPEGLEGENIPLGARIIMVADTVDAMLTTRSYRDPLDEEDVHRELRMLKGEQFDPDVVEAALDAGIVADAAESHGEPERELERTSG